MVDTAEGIDAAGDDSIEVANPAEVDTSGTPEVAGLRARLSGLIDSKWGLALYTLLVVVLMALAIGPSNLSWGNAFIARGLDVGEPWVVPGDHLQLAYNLWLWHDAITTFDHWPWIDPYLYGAAGGGMVNMFGWPLVLFSLPISLVWGPVAAYNSTVYASFPLAALFTAAWLRALNLSRLAAAAGGLAFAFAPFRILQSTGHANALLAWMFPMLLLCLEKAMRGPDEHARRWAYASVASLASIVLAGESHHSVFAALLTAVYLLIRLRSTPMERFRVLIVPAVVGVIVTGGLALMVWHYIIRPSDARGGRKMSEAAHFAPRFGDLFAADWIRFERYTYVGAVIGILAICGLVAAFVHRRHRRLALGLAAGVVVCAWFSIAPAFVGHPTLQNTYRLVPFFSFSRVPGRLMVVGALLLAALVALAFDAARQWARPWMLAPLGLLLLVDLPLPLYNSLQDGSNPYSDLAEDATIMELPTLDPGDVAGSIFSLYVMRQPGPRVGGYFVYVPTDREDLNRRAAVLEDQLGDACGWRDFQLDAQLDYVAVYRQIYPETADADAIERELAALPGLDLVGTTNGVTTFEVTDPTFGCEER